jgi:acyl-CoA thioesterase-2
MESALPSLLEVLDLDRVDQGVYVGRPSEDGRNRVFGGHTIAQALAAACFSVEDMPCHSMHAYFVRPGLPGRPTQYEVSAIRDGNSFATRQVVAVQRDEVVLTLSASFHRSTESEAGFSYSAAPPVAPSPESFPDEAARTERLLQSLPPDLHDRVRRTMPVEAIRVDDFAPLPPPEHDPESFQRTRPSRVWMRARADAALPDDINFHRCALAYASDAGALEPSLRAVGASFGDNGLQVASLDHALWFHRPLRFDDWLLFTFESSVVAEGRALSRGSVFDRKGVLVASIAQEGVLRRRSERA